MVLFEKEDKVMKRLAGLTVAFSLAVLGLVLCLIPDVAAQNAGNGFAIIDPDSIAYGTTYSQYAAGWWQWVFSIPTAVHPLFENGDCSTGQSGPVWFLGNSFVSNTIVRNCNVPSGKALFIPIGNAEDSVIEESNGDGCSDPTFDGSIVGVSRCAESFINRVTPSAEIDQVPIQIGKKFRILSSAFTFTLPADNVLQAAIPAHSYPAGTYFPSVAVGYFLLVAPLSPGPHLIHFHVARPNGSFLDTTYHLVVAQ